MPAWLKMAVAVVVAVVPGAFLMLLAYATGRTLQQSWRLARQQANGGNVPVRAVLANLHLREIVRNARLAA